ncbi:MAG: hypothetical protein ACLFT3_02635 [Cyclobacteriaceae bacterium]
MEEIKNLFILIAVVVGILLGASLPWLIILAYGFQTLAAEMEQTQFTSGLGNAYVLLLILGMVGSFLILYFLVSWVAKNKKQMFDV